MSKQISPRYDAAFKRRAAEQVFHHHQPVAAVARQLHCSPQSVANWVMQYQNDARSNRSPKSIPSLSHPVGQTSFCQFKKPLLHSAKASSRHSVDEPPSRCTTFLPVEVGEISLISSVNSTVSTSRKQLSFNKLQPRN